MGKTSLVRALMSTASKCAVIDLDDRTVGIDRYDMQLFPSSPSPSFALARVADSRSLQLSVVGACAAPHLAAAPITDVSPAMTPSTPQVPQNGQHEFVFPSGNRYTGEWKNSMPHGAGTMQFANGASYEGDWVAGRRHGRGVTTAATDGKSELFGYSWKAGDVYDGGWKSDVRHGKCVYTWFNGDKLACRWSDGKCPEWSSKNDQVLQSLAMNIQIWDLAGQDVYTLSHSVHFSHRSLYLLLWKPGESLDTTMRRVTPWLEALCMHVPDALVVMVASHCKTNISDDAFLQLSRQVEAAAAAKVQELNSLTRLEVDKLRTMLVGAEQELQRVEADYTAHASSTPELAQADSDFAQQCGHAAGCEEFLAARASAVGVLPRSLILLAADVHQAFVREGLLRERLQRLLGIRDGGRPDDRDACTLSLHCKSVDSVDGHGIAELRGWMYDHCLSLPFMGEMISTNWTAVADVFRHIGDSVLSKDDAVALVRQRLPQIPRLKVSAMMRFGASSSFGLLSGAFTCTSRRLCVTPAR